MGKYRMGASALGALSVLIAATATVAGEPASQPKAGSIEGTWRMVSFRYGDKSSPLQKLTGDRVMLKHITPGRFAWVDYSAKTKQVARMAGGTFTLKGKMYQETVEYGTGSDIQSLLGKGQEFEDSIGDKTWHHQGKLSTGLEIEENWERVR